MVNNTISAVVPAKAGTYNHYTMMFSSAVP
jgi:hypothetical protein